MINGRVLVFLLITLPFLILLDWWRILRFKGAPHHSSDACLWSPSELLWFVRGLCLEERRTGNRKPGGPHELHQENPNSRGKWLWRMEKSHQKEMGKWQKTTKGGIAKRWKIYEKSCKLRESSHCTSFYKNDRKALNTPLFVSQKKCLQCLKKLNPWI